VNKQQLLARMFRLLPRKGDWPYVDEKERLVVIMALITDEIKKEINLGTMSWGSNNSVGIREDLAKEEK
jgi:hypothetical protein